MELSIPATHINTQNIYFTEKKKNIIMDGNFVKILYSNDAFEMNGLSIFVELESIKENHSNNIQTNFYNPAFSYAKQTKKMNIGTEGFAAEDSSLNVNMQKNNIILNPYSIENSRLIKILCKMENDIIERYISSNCPSKIASYILKNQLTGGTIKCQSEEKYIESKPPKTNLLSFGGNLNPPNIQSVCNQPFAFATIPYTKQKRRHNGEDLYLPINANGHFQPKKNMNMHHFNYKQIQLLNSFNAEPEYSIIKQKCILKISGIWETTKNVGITMKFTLLH